MSPATHHCPGRRFPGRACRPPNADGACPVHQTYCQRDDIVHLKTEPCPACEKRALHEESGDPPTPTQSAEELAKQIKILVCEMHLVLGIPIEANCKEQDGELNGELVEELIEELGEHDEEHEGAAGGGVIENGNN